MTSKELREKRAALVKQAREILALPEKENRQPTGEENAKWDAMMKDVDSLKADIDRVERQEAHERELIVSRGGASGGDPPRGIPSDPKELVEIENRAFRNWIRYGFTGLKEEEAKIMARLRYAIPPELRALSVGTTTAGGFTVPQGFSGQLEESLKEFGGMRLAATIIPTASGNDLPWPTTDDTANSGAILAENTATAEQDVLFGQIIFKAFKYTSKLVRVSIELLQDSAFPLDTMLPRWLGTRIARITNAHFTTGVGTTEPRGAVTASSVGKNGLTGQTTSIIYDDLVDLLHSVDPAYQRNGTFMMNDNSLTKIKKIKDSQNRPLWLAGLAERAPDTILGKSFAVNQDIATMAANAKSVLFGDFSKYIIRDVQQVVMLRLVERYADLGQVGFLIFTRHDGNLLDAGTDPIKHYANSAT